jgi:hypothetical protein
VAAGLAQEQLAKQLSDITSSLTERGCVDASTGQEEKQLSESDFESEQDTDCFDMDPCGEPSAWSSKNRSSTMNSRWFCTGGVCRAPGCSMPSQQQLPEAADLTGLLAAVHLGQQQQQLQGDKPALHQQCHEQQDLAYPNSQQQQQQASGRCPCSCHVAAFASSGDATAGTQQSTSAVGSSGGGSSSGGSARQLYANSSNSGRRGSAETGAASLKELHNESFGKVTCADLLTHLR